MDKVYDPREDSELIASCIPKYVKGVRRALDMGTGSGYLASIAANSVDTVVAADKNPVAISYAKERYPLPNVTYVVSDLFSNIEGEFDLILFNAPYLPSEEGVSDMALDGGKQGWEVVGRFLASVNKHLSKNGVILLLFSSLTHREKVEELIIENGFIGKSIAELKEFFEELYVYEIRRKQ